MVDKITAKRLPEAHIKKNQFGLVTVRVILRTSIRKIPQNQAKNTTKSPYSKRKSLCQFI